MGRYIEWDDVVARYKTVAGDATSPELQEGWVAGAEDHIDAALGMRHTVPFTAPIPGIVKDIAVDLVFFKMTVRSPDSKLLKEFIDERLEALQNGTLTLAGGSTGDFSHAQKSYHSSFGLDDPTRWRVDRDAIEDARGERE